MSTSTPATARLSAPISTLGQFFASSIGRKYLMAFSGLIWSGFVLVHMAGNLFILGGPQAYNEYGYHAVTSPITLPVEILLVLTILMHIFMGVYLAATNRAARPARYAMPTNGQKAVTRASRTMILHGLVLLVFIVTHLATFKFGPHYDVTYDGVVMRDLWKLMVEVYANPWIVAWYVISVALLAWHLSHGVQSLFQSVGFRHPRYTPWIQFLGKLYGVLVGVGFAAEPLYIFFQNHH